jgi:polysaccharide deacetylase 2 family uncharacterized protein YibQ
MNQKKTNKKKKNKDNLQKNLPKIFLIILTITLIASISSYMFLSDKKEEPIKVEEPQTKISENESATTDELKLFDEKKTEEDLEQPIKDDLHNKFEEYTNELDKDFIDKADNEELNEKIVKKLEEIKEEKKKEQVKTETLPPDIAPKIEKEKKEIKDEIKKSPSTYNDKDYVAPKKDNYVFDNKSKPKIAIIIDDVSTSAEKEKILNIGYKITMAFLPPTKGHPNSAKIALDLPFYMIHFPMQASSAFKGAEEFTLHVGDSYEKIEKRVAQLREWYPNAIYTNNHTGSVFTENEESMDRLLKALKKYNFIFVDSRTSAKSVAKKYALKYDMPYIVRNTFIDNDRSYGAIQSQLKKSIEIAKKTGYAIAIGHPHDITIKVLRESKHLLKDVEPIYVNQLPYLK